MYWLLGGLILLLFLQAVFGYDGTVLFFVFFFFKQKTAYKMRISDWSSDVCSSDLVGARPDGVFQRAQIELLDIGPDHPRRMRGPDQAVQVHDLKLDLIAHRFAQPRLARIPGRRSRRFRQVVEQSITRHQSLLRAKRSLDGITMPSTTQHKSFNMPKDSQALSLTKDEAASVGPNSFGRARRSKAENRPGQLNQDVQIEAARHVLP